MIALNNRYIYTTEEERNQITRLENLFFENEHNLLRGGKLKKADRELIDHLYYKFFHSIDNYDWSGSCINLELENLKHDGICGKNTNKVAWSKSILLNWYKQLGEQVELTAEDLYFELGARDSKIKMTKYFYSKKD